MNNLHRELAPISDGAWAQIEQEAARTLKRYLAGRRVVDVKNPGGVGLAAIGTGHLRNIDPPGEGIIARQREGAELEQWGRVKRAASQAIVDGGGTITHHHAVGRDHAPWLQDEIGRAGVAALRALKAELDPAGIMNPGKLFFGMVDSQR